MLYNHITRMKSHKHGVILNIPPEGKQYWYSKFWSVLTNSLYVISLNIPIIIISCTFHLLNGLHAYTLITLVTMMQNVISNLSFNSDLTSNLTKWSKCTRDINLTQIFKNKYPRLIGFLNDVITTLHFVTLFSSCLNSSCTYLFWLSVTLHGIIHNSKCSPTIPNADTTLATPPVADRWPARVRFPTSIMVTRSRISSCVYSTLSSMTDNSCGSIRSILRTRNLVWVLLDPIR